MIVETPFDFDWDEAFARLATLPRQEEWERICPSFRLPARVQHLPRNGG